MALSPDEPCIAHRLLRNLQTELMRTDISEEYRDRLKNAQLVYFTFQRQLQNRATDDVRILGSKLHSLTRYKQPQKQPEIPLRISTSNEPLSSLPQSQQPVLGSVGVKRLQEAYAKQTHEIASLKRELEEGKELNTKQRFHMTKFMSSLKEQRAVKMAALDNYLNLIVSVTTQQKAELARLKTVIEALEVSNRKLAEELTVSKKTLEAEQASNTTQTAEIVGLKERHLEAEQAITTEQVKTRAIDTERRAEIARLRKDLEAERATTTMQAAEIGSLLKKNIEAQKEIDRAQKDIANLAKKSDEATLLFTKQEDEYARFQEMDIQAKKSFNKKLVDDWAKLRCNLDAEQKYGIEALKEQTVLTESLCKAEATNKALETKVQELQLQIETQKADTRTQRRRTSDSETTLELLRTLHKHHRINPTADQVKVLGPNRKRKRTGDCSLNEGSRIGESIVLLEWSGVNDCVAPDGRKE